MHLTGRRPKIRFPDKANVTKQTAQLDARSERSSELQDAKPTPKPAQHSGLESHLPPSIGHTDPEERRMRLGSDAMNFVVNHRIQSIKSLRKHDLALGDGGQWERFADGAEACQTHTIDESQCC